MNRHSLSTSNSKKNIAFIVKLLIFCTLITAYIFLILPQYAGTYNASIVDKARRLRSIKEPKIVLIGNSNLSFGMDSELLEKEVGMPVVNMGLNAEIGNYFHEEMCKMNIVPGDIYVICHNDYDDDEKLHDPIAAWATVEDHVSLWGLIGWRNIPKMAETFPIYLKRCLALHASGEGNRFYNSVYSRDSVSERGDIVRYRGECEYPFTDLIEPGKISDESVERINELNRYLTERGATLVVAGFPIGNGINTVDGWEYEEFQKQLEEKLDCPVISNFTDYMFGYDCFYDSDVHLNSEGAKLRTEQLAKDLKSFLSKEN